MREITIGGVRESTHLVEELELPILEEIDALAWIGDAVDQAAAERKGIAVVGRKGAGKTVAAAQALRRFEAAEKQIAKADDRYEKRRAIVVQGPRSAKRVEVLAEIWYAATGVHPFRLVRGRRKSDEQLLDELIVKLAHENIAVVIVDEAENLSEEGLIALRDIISKAEGAAKNRFSGQGYRPAGVGVVLVGTYRLKARLIRSEEAGHRWVSIREVEDLTPAEAAEVYRHFLPCFAAHAEELGEDEWKEYVRLRVVKGRPVPVRQIENHVRSYVRRVAAESEEEIESKADIPFDQELFEWTLAELVVPASTEE